MPLPQLFVLGIMAMAGIAALRFLRVRRGLTPLPDGRARRLFQIAFLVIPPVVLGALTQPPPPANQLWGLGAVPAYIAVIALLATLMWIASQVVGVVAHGRSARLVRLALSGHEGDAAHDHADPPVTVKLAESVRVVDRANAVFPRGPAFPAEISRAGFRDDWDTLDGATSTLEGRIADDHRHGLAVATAATNTADDARSRLDTLRRLAGDQGQAWAAT
jgi:hypothetical protein